MKAIHKYKGSNKPEHRRRIAQSFRYKMTIWDMPHMIALLKRGGIDLMTDYVDNLKPQHKDGDVIEL